MFREFIYEDRIPSKARYDYAMLNAYLRAHIPNIRLTLDLTSHECFSNGLVIQIGYKAPEVFNISILDTFLHEIYHNILPKLPEYDKYSDEQVNFCEDLEINSKLGLDHDDMNVVHPRKMGLSTGLTTLEYLRILFPEQESEFPNFSEGQFGDQFLEQSLCGHKRDGEKQGHRRFSKVDIREFGFNPEPLTDQAIISFLEEAKTRAQTYIMSSQIRKTYSKLSRRSHDPGIITPGSIEVLGEPYQMGRMPVLMLDNSASMWHHLALANSIMGYAHDDFCIQLYNDKPGWKFYPWDKNVTFIPDGGTSVYRAVDKIIKEDSEAVGDFFVITDGQDPSIYGAAAYVRNLGHEFRALRIKEGEAAYELDI